MIAAALGAVLLAAPPSPVPQRGPSAFCPRATARLVQEWPLAFPVTARPTHDRMRFLVDLGSDGRVRRSVLVESSGDAALDAAAASALVEFRYAVPTAGCVSASTVWGQFWRLRPEDFASPAPPPDASASASPSAIPSAPPSATPSASAAACGAPYVFPRHFPLPLRRQVPGTAFVDVGLDAHARVTAVHLARSSGNKKTDYAATIAARNATYVFVPVPGCPAAATTYRLELTFR